MGKALEIEMGERRGRPEEKGDICPPFTAGKTRDIAAERGMVAAKLANMTQGARTDLEPSANLQNVSQSRAAELLNV